MTAAVPAPAKNLADATNHVQFTMDHTKLMAGQPIVVDLDGTLVKTDTLIEALLTLLKRKPLIAFLVFFWVVRGLSYMKQRVALEVTLNAEEFPYNTELLDWLRAQKNKGHPLWLCTASHYLQANKIADHLGLFSGVIASNETVNLKGHRKGESLKDRFGSRGFIYCGNAYTDLAVWLHASSAVVIGGRKLQRAASQQTEICATFAPTGLSFRLLLKAIRVHQWAKNILVFAAAGAAHRLGEWSILAQGLGCFIAFSMCASSVYLVNDLLDLASDRLHPRKRSRPFASGDLPVIFGIALAPLLLVASLALAAYINLIFLVVLFIYFITTTAYTFYLKKTVLLDIFVLAVLYTARIIGGATATSIEPSNWLLMLSLFLFLSLALVKRYAELSSVQLTPATKASGRGYYASDMTIIQSMGIASAYATTLVLALYISNPETGSRYMQPQFLWLLCPLQLYWISRIWIVTHRGFMHDDPLVFAFRDRISLITALVAISVIFLAT